MFHSGVVYGVPKTAFESSGPRLCEFVKIIVSSSSSNFLSAVRSRPCTRDDGQNGDNSDYCELTIRGWIFFPKTLRCLVKIAKQNSRKRYTTTRLWRTIITTTTTIVIINWQPPSDWHTGTIHSIVRITIQFNHIADRD